MLHTLEPDDIAQAHCPSTGRNSHHLEMLRQCLGNQLLSLVNQPLRLLPQRNELRLELQVALVRLLDVDIFGPQLPHLRRELVRQVYDLMEDKFG